MKKNRANSKLMNYFLCLLAYFSPLYIYIYNNSVVYELITHNYICFSFGISQNDFKHKKKSFSLLFSY